MSAWAQYAPFQPPGGLAPATLVGSQTLAQMQAATLAVQAVAAAAVPSSQKGVAGGVAALDDGGDVTAPLTGDATHAAVTPAGGSATMLGAYLGMLAKSSDLSAYLTVAAAGQSYATQTALAATAAIANAAIPSGRIGAASGVAGLDASGRVTAPIAGDLTPAVVTPTGGSQVNIADALASYATQAGLTAETTRATGAEATLQSNINIEATTRANADALLYPKTGGAISGAVTIGGTLTTAQNVNIGSGSVAVAANEVFKSNGGGIYYDAQITVTGGTSGAVNGGNMSINAAIVSLATGTGQLAKAPTPAAGDNSTNIATTAALRREIATGYTVVTLPTDARRYAGARAYVTDATACTFLGSLTGGGATFCPVIYNGTSWVAE
ncbi:hypothetical protein GCM10023157_12550 [Gluconacetobacter asukensis]